MKPISRCWPNEYVFLLTHENSLATTLPSLMRRQLGINGSSGSRLRYERGGDLLRLRWRVAREIGTWPKGRFLFDTIVNNDQFVPSQLTNSSRLRVLVCLCRPERSLNDMLHKAVGDVAMSPQRAAEIYCERAEWLAAVSENLGERALVFPAEMIVEQTDALLAAIHIHLDFDTTLSTAAGTRRNQSASDSPQCSDFRTSWKRRDSDIPSLMGPSLMNQCRQAYLQARVELSRWCLSIGLTRYEEDLHARPLVAEMRSDDMAAESAPQPRNAAFF
jgi:hypothetical protein